MPSRRRLRVKLPPGVAVVVLILVLLFTWLSRRQPQFPPAPPEPSEGYLLTCWNVENLYDDRDDPRDHGHHEDWYARDPAALAAKHRLLTDALLAQNNGRGPDLLALVEVENRRAVELLRESLNAALPDALEYPPAGLIHRDNIIGRRIEPAILSRLPVVEDRALGDFDHRRILAARVEVAGAPLIVLASHWTSRVTDHSGAKRAAYGDALYQAFRSEYRLDPAVDLVICGDFNDEPTDPSIVAHLRALGDPARLLPGDPQPFLLNLMAGRDPEQFGTYLYRDRWEILDHIAVSPGLLDRRGWHVVPGTLLIRNAPSLRGGRDRGPLRFGDAENPNPRGPSDHFAVSVRLSLRDDKALADTDPPAADPVLDGG